MRFHIVLLMVACLPLAGALGQTADSGSTDLPAGLMRVLQHVPDDTHLVLVAPEIGKLFKGVAAFGSAIGVDEVADVSAEELLEDVLGDEARAVDMRGPGLLALSAERDDPLIILTLRSAEPLREKYGEPAKLEDAALYQLDDERSVAVIGDGITIIGRDKSEVKLAVVAKGEFTRRLMPPVRRMLGERQLVFWADMRAWRPKIQQTTSFVAQSMYMGLAAAGPEADAAIRMYKVLFDQLDSFLAETETYAAALSVDRERVFIEDRATFIANGKVPGYLRQVKKSKRDLLRGLPSEAALVFAAEWEQPSGVEGFSERFVRAMFEQASGTGADDPAARQEALESILATQRKMTGQSGSFRINPSGDGFLIVGQYLTSEPDELRKLVRDGFLNQPIFREIWSMPAWDVKHESTRIGNEEVDLFRFQFAETAEQFKPMIQAVYGDEPLYCLARGPDGLAYVVGAEEGAKKMLMRVIEGEKPLRSDPRVAEFLAGVSANPQFCVLADLPRLLGAVLGVLESTGMPVPAIDMGDRELPLIGLTAYVDQEALRAEILIPSAPIGVLVEELQEAEDRKAEAF